MREKLGGKSGGIGGPRCGVIATAGLRSEEPGIAQPAMAQKVALGTADFEACAGTLGIAAPGVEVGENGGDAVGRQAVAELLFIIATMTARGREGSAHPLWDARLRPSATLRAAAGRPRAERIPISLSSFAPTFMSSFAPTPTTIIVSLTPPHSLAAKPEISG